MKTNLESDDSLSRHGGMACIARVNHPGCRMAIVSCLAMRVFILVVLFAQLRRVIIAPADEKRCNQTEQANRRSARSATEAIP
ncbi:hypothetical protein [Paraburkholderia acidiphila]|uniref:Uncharacterized protein n=1 Tax=Paraburkholderia acidiphila TaxID=2571747 RepID=A0A7Z2GDJ1_9BURK|nr:hypothetical protein [Paraburkholderia acidiphila]QGZ59846.1 hypothetical protein FAZ97_33385 [Paraburkholderia acidiphila]